MSRCSVCIGLAPSWGGHDTTCPQHASNALTVAEQRALAWFALGQIQDRRPPCDCKVCEWLTGQRRQEAAP